MKKIVLLAIIIASVIFFSLTKENIKVLSDISYDKNKKCNNLVYLLENNKYIPFLVLSSNYNGNTLLLRQDTLEQQMPMNEYSAYYENSYIDQYLNDTYLKSLENINTLIVNSKIDIVNEASLGVTGNNIKQIERKVFLLSYSEVIEQMDTNGVEEGKKIKFFKDQNRRQAFCNNEKSSWWLRTPNTYYISCSYVVGSNNKIGCTNVYDYNGIRPAFCIKNNVKIEKRFLKDLGKIYVISN